MIILNDHSRWIFGSAEDFQQQRLTRSPTNSDISSTDKNTGLDLFVARRRHDVYDDKGQELADGDRFYFETFGFPVEAQ